MKNVYQRGRNPPQIFAVDWITSDLTPNIAMGSPGVGSILLGVGLGLANLKPRPRPKPDPKIHSFSRNGEMYASGSGACFCFVFSLSVLTPSFYMQRTARFSYGTEKTQGSKGKTLLC
jgi:hypothetical protein